MRHQIGGYNLFVFHPAVYFGQIIENADPYAGHKSISIASTDLLGGDGQLGIDNVCYQLHPQCIFSAAPNRHDALGNDTFMSHDFHVVADAESHTFQNGSIDVTACVLEAQAKQNASGSGIVQGGTFALEVGQGVIGR